MARELTAAILEDCREDWYGLWEIYANVTERMGSSPACAWSTDIDIDPKFGSELRTELADLIGDGLLEAKVWSDGPPRLVSASEMRNLDLDSVWWKSPGVTDADDQLRIAATDEGMRRP